MSCRLPYNSDSLVDEIDKWLARPASTPDIRTLLRVPNFFEDLALMVDLGRLDLRYVAKAFLTITQTEWAFWSPSVDRLRLASPTAYTQFEQLVLDLATCVAD